MRVSARCFLFFVVFVLGCAHGKTSSAQAGDSSAVESTAHSPATDAWSQMDEARATLRREVQRLDDVSGQPVSLKDGLEHAIRSLFVEHPTPGAAVVVDNFTYKGEDTGSEAGLFLQDAAKDALLSGGLRVYPHEKLEAESQKTGKSLEVLAADGSMCLLMGSFWEKDDGIILFLKRRDSGKGLDTGGAQVKVRKDDLPVDTQIRPPKPNDAVKALSQSFLSTAPASDFVVRVAPLKGDGATYSIGEDMVIRVQANRDCYIKVYAAFADGRTKLVFPNKYDTTNRLRQGQVRMLGATDTFHFPVTEPTGREVLRVVASTQQFDGYDDLVRRLQEINQVVYDGIDDTSYQGVRGFVIRGLGIAPGAAKAEAKSEYVVVRQVAGTP